MKLQEVIEQLEALGNHQDEAFSKDKLMSMQKLVKHTIHQAEPRVPISMNNFVTNVAVTYIPLHDYAKQIAQEIGEAMNN